MSRSPCSPAERPPGEDMSRSHCSPASCPPEFTSEFTSCVLRVCFMCASYVYCMSVACVVQVHFYVYLRVLQPPAFTSSSSSPLVVPRCPASSSIMCAACEFHVYFIVYLLCILHVYVHLYFTCNLCSSCVQLAYSLCAACVLHVYFTCTSTFSISTSSSPLVVPVKVSSIFIRCVFFIRTSCVFVLCSECILRQLVV